MLSSERVEAMELLWESFAKEGIDYPSPAWHGKILADRSKIIDSGKDLKKHLRNLFELFGREDIPGIRKEEELEIA